MARRRLWLVVIVAAVAACGGSGNDDGVDFGNLIESAQGTQLTLQEHPDGWGRRDCFLCHPAEDIHQEDRTGTGVLPLADIRALVRRDGLESCALCHGSNGVED